MCHVALSILYSGSKYKTSIQVNKSMSSYSIPMSITFTENTSQVSALIKWMKTKLEKEEQIPGRAGNSGHDGDAAKGLMICVADSMQLPILSRGTSVDSKQGLRPHVLAVYNH